jgi:2-phosphosulfolactate phosphatase
MKIDLHFTPTLVDELSLRDRTVVVVDVLRASSTIVTALSNGAREVIPTATVESAMKIAGSLGADQALLGGERHGKMIPGFDLGNSPYEYAQGKVRGKSIVFSTTNGSQAMVKARYAAELAICGFINMAAVASFLREGSKDFTILCSGRSGGFSLEDTVCGGMLIARVSEDEEAQLTDGALAAMSLYRTFGRGLLKMMRASEHGRYLEEIGLGNDIKYCASVDAVPVLPLLEGNVIRLRRATREATTPTIST